MRIPPNTTHTFILEEKETIVHVTVPKDEYGNPLTIWAKKELPNLTYSMRSTKDFKLIRLVMNLTVSPAGGGNFDNQRPVSFDHLIKIEVECWPDDLYKAARDGRELKLAYWDGSTWVILNHIAYSYALMPPEGNLPYRAVVFVNEWPADPAIGWGE